MRDIRVNDRVKVKPQFADEYTIDPDTIFVVESIHETRYGPCLVIFDKYHHKVAYPTGCFMIVNPTIFTLGDAEE